MLEPNGKKYRAGLRRNICCYQNDLEVKGSSGEVRHLMD